VSLILKNVSTNPKYNWNRGLQDHWSRFCKPFLMCLSISLLHW